MNLVELEGLQDVWNETPEPPKRQENKILFADVDRTNEGWEFKPNDYFCYEGRYVGENLFW